MSIIKPHKFEHFFQEFKHSIDLVFKNYQGDLYIEYLDIVNQVPTNVDNNRVIYNTEQLTRGNMLHRLFDLSKRYIIFDYSSANLDLIKKINNQSKTCLVPILFNKEVMCFDKNTTKEYDVIFIGDVSTRRHTIIKALSENGLRIFVMTCCYDFKLKHEMIMKARVLVNIHASEDYKIFEFARCSVPVFNDCLVVSEPSLTETGSLVNDYVLSKVIFAEYDNFVNKVIDVVNNYEKYVYKSSYSDLEELTNKEILKIKSELEYII